MQTDDDTDSTTLEEAVTLDRIETLFKTKAMKDSAQREEVVRYAREKNSVNYVELFDFTQEYFQTPELHSKKRTMIIAAYRKYFDEESESHVLLRDDWRQFMEAHTIRLENDIKSTTQHENDLIVRMMEKIAVTKLMNLFARYSWDNRKSLSDQFGSASNIKRTQSNLSSKWGSFTKEVKKKTSLVNICFRK